MVFNIMSPVNEITAWYDLTDILSVMIGCSATFVAIIGGLIANKAISDKAEQESIERQLYQIDTEYTVNEEHIQNINMWLNEYNAREFIHENIDELLDGKSLFDVYDNDNDNEIEYDELLPYWDKSLKAAKLYYDAIVEDGRNSRNDDNIPRTIISDLDDFQYRFCSHYGMKIHVRKFASNLINYTVSINAGTIEQYNEKVKEMEELINDNTMLNAKTQLLEKRKSAMYIDGDIKGGMKLFAIISIINIILPIVFMLFNPTQSKVWYYIETAISLLAFSVGIITMIKYIYSLFPKKKADIEETEPENE